MSTALRSLSDRDLLNSTKVVVPRERGITVIVLDHLYEVDRRKLYLTLGYSSMFAYCTGELGYSASATKRRISTTRCIARFPEVLPLLKANEVNLSTITQVSEIMTPHNSSAILSRIRRKSQREVEAIVAEYEPLSTLPRERARTVVVRIPARTVTDLNTAAATVPPVAIPLAAEPSQEMQAAQNTMKTNQDRNGPEPDRPSLPAMHFERRTVIQFCAREAVMTKLDRVRALASHRLPANAPLEQVIEFLADYFSRREDPQLRHERRETRADNARRAGAAKTSSARAIPARVRDEVFVSDRGECSYQGPDGRKCESNHVVQVDHIKPVARGGASTRDNLRLLCAYHNRLEAERLMGRSGPPA
jgi:5-methylcytosine-specific restriction endonuclease McrA